MKYLSWDGAKALMDKIRTSLNGKSDKGHSHSAEDIKSGELNISRIADNSIPLSKMQSDIQDKINYPTYHHSGDRFSSLIGKGWHRIAVLTKSKTNGEAPILTLDGFSTNLGGGRRYFNCTFSICPGKENGTSFVQLNCSYECYVVIPKIRVVRPANSINDIIYIDIYHYYDDNYSTLHASISNAQYARFVDTAEFNPTIPDNYTTDEFETSQKCGIKCNNVNDIDISTLARKSSPTFTGLVNLPIYNSGAITYNIAQTYPTLSSTSIKSILLNTKVVAFTTDVKIHIYGGVYAVSKTIDMQIFIKYADEAFGECSAVSIGTYEPGVKLFTYLSDGAPRIGIGLIFANTSDLENSSLRLNVDVHDYSWKKYDSRWEFKVAYIPDNSIDVPISKPPYNADDISGLADVAVSGDYDDLSNKPTSLPANGGNADTLGGMSADDFSAAEHTHMSADITDKDTAPTSGSDKLVTSGGVYTALGKKQATVTGGASTITSSNLTANRALVSDASGKVAVSAVTSTELGYIDGVTSNVQTQLNGKTPYAVKSSADFNTMTTPGLYTMRSSSTNAPTTGSYHSLIVNKSDNGNYIQQIAIKESTTDMYMRYCSGSTWSGWVKVAKINDIPTSLKNPNSLTLTMNGTASTYNGELANSKSWYAPTTAGTAGYELVSSGSGAPVWKAPAYAVCSTAAATVEKTVSVSNFKLVTGAKILIKFSYANIANTPTLNVNSTGAKQIQYKGKSLPSSYLQTLQTGIFYEFVYDGTYWQLIRDNEIGNGIYNAMGGFYNSTVNSTNYPNIKSFLLAPMTYNNLTIDCASSCEFIGTGEIPIHYFPYTGANYSTKTRFDNPSIKASQSVTFRNILFTGNSFISEVTATYDVRYQFIDCDFCIDDGWSGTPLFSLKNSSIEFVNCRFYLNVNRPGPCFHIIDSTNNNNGTTSIKLSNSIVNYSSVGDDDPVFATTNGNSTRVVIEDSYMGNMSPIKPTAEFYALHGIFIKNTTFDSCNRIGSVTTYSSLTKGYFIVNGCCFTGTDAATIYASGHTVNISNNTFVVRSNIYLHGDYNVFSNNVNCYPINLYEYGNGIITGNTASSFSQSVSSSTYAKTGNYPTIS